MIFAEVDPVTLCPSASSRSRGRENREEDVEVDRLSAWLRRSEGQTFVEYALILAAVVALVFGVVVTGLGAAVQNAVTQATNAFGA